MSTVYRSLLHVSASHTHQPLAFECNSCLSMFLEISVNTFMQSHCLRYVTWHLHCRATLLSTDLFLPFPALLTQTWAAGTSRQEECLLWHSFIHCEWSSIASSYKYQPLIRKWYPSPSFAFLSFCFHISTES